MSEAKKKPKTELDILSTYEAESPLATELRRIYQNMSAVKQGRKHKSFMVTSAMRGEGKSTVTSNLAVTIAQYPSRKVLVIDCDLRRPRVHKIFGVPNSPGTFECLNESVDPLEVVRKTKLPNLDVIPGGGPTTGASQLFESGALSPFFEKAKFYYDIVLVDSPPVLAVSDTLFLCPEVEAVLYVLLAGVTAREVILRATQVLRDSEANIIGAIVNNAPEILPYYYDYKYYGYQKE